jgi:hypothetical protein
MANVTYMKNRRKYKRPQALLFSKKAACLSDGYYYPEGYEFGKAEPSAIDGQYDWSEPDFMVLSDHGRNGLSMEVERLESRERMIDGTMRSVHVADKLKISVSWEMLPSRAFDGALYGYGINSDDTSADFGKIQHPFCAPGHTVDGGAGGAEMAYWHKQNTGAFYVLLAYDNPTNFSPQFRNSWTGDSDRDLERWSPYAPYQLSAYDKFEGNDYFKKYNEQLKMYIDSFSYEISKRGGLYDFWEVSLSLVEA